MNERLTRSRDDRLIAGVAGGLADLWGADPTLVRLVWVLLAVFTGGIALIVYIVMAIVVPEEDPGRWPSPPTAVPGSTPPGVAGSVPTGAPTPAAWTGPIDPWTARRAARGARRAERRARGDSGLPLFFGGLLVILGILLLVRQWLPQIDFDWFGPTLLIGLGVLLLVIAVDRRGDPTGPSTTARSAGTQGGAQ